MVFERYIRDYVNIFDKLDRGAWNYEDGCVLIGEEAMYGATGDERYFDSIKNYVDRYVRQDGTIKGYDPEEYNIDRIPSGRVLYLLYDNTGDVRYLKAVEQLMTQIRNQPRTRCRNFWHKKIYPYQIWLDGLYMGMPFYMIYEKRFDQCANYPDIINQFKNVRKLLFDQEKKLYYHACDESREVFWADPETGLSANFWTRAMGWYLMALTDCYEILGDDYPDYRTVLQKLLQEAIDGLLTYQDEESGLFYQLTALKDEEGNYLEMSGSCMISCALLKGVRLGMLQEEKYRPKGEEILMALELRCMKLSGGRLSLTRICGGAGLGPAGNTRRDGSIRYYLHEPVVEDEQKGAGVLMLAYSEWLRLNAEGRTETLGYPKVSIYNRGYEQFN